MDLSEQKRNLYNSTNNPDYDIDDFSAQMERIVDGQLEELLKVKGQSTLCFSLNQQDQTCFSYHEKISFFLECG